MNRLLIIALILSLASCASSQEDPAQTMPIEKTEQPPTPTQPTPTKATNTENSPNKKPRQKYITSTSRAPTQIKKEYPYDIDLKTAEGKVIPSSDAFASNGKPTVLLFWLTTCVPCRFEMKAIHEKYEGWTKEADFNLYAISTDFEKNYENFVKRVEESDWPWETYNDMNREFRFAMEGNLNGLPQTFVLNKDGKVVYHKRKYTPGDEDKLFEKIKALAMK